MMDLVYECTDRPDLGAQRLMVGPGPFGTRTGETQFEDQYFRTLVRMESGAPTYAWVNTTVFLARGRIVPSGVEYELFRVT